MYLVTIRVDQNDEFRAWNQSAKPYARGNKGIRLDAPMNGQPQCRPMGQMPPTPAFLNASTKYETTQLAWVRFNEGNIKSTVNVGVEINLECFKLEAAGDSDRPTF